MDWGDVSNRCHLRTNAPCTAAKLSGRLGAFCRHGSRGVQDTDVIVQKSQAVSALRNTITADDINPALPY